MGPSVVLAACSFPPLAEVPIDGGTPAVREALREELASFDLRTGGGRVELRRIVIRRDDEVNGRWTPGLHRILIADDLGPVEAPIALRHELCHALDTAEGSFYLDHSALYGRLSAGLQGIGYEFDCDDATCARREAFARFCELGGWYASAGAEVCAGDAPDANAVFAHLMDRVWRGPRELGRATLADELRWVETAFLPDDVDGFTDGGSIATFDWDNLVTGDHSAGRYDVWTGERATTPPTSVLAPWGHPPGLPTTEVSVRQAGGREDGEAYVLLELGSHDLPGLPRSVWSDGDRWFLVDDGCLTGTDPFWADETVFDLRIDGASFGWAPLEPVEP